MEHLTIMNLMADYADLHGNDKLIQALRMVLLMQGGCAKRASNFKLAKRLDKASAKIWKANTPDHRAK